MGAQAAARHGLGGSQGQAPADQEVRLETSRQGADADRESQGGCQEPRHVSAQDVCVSEAEAWGGVGTLSDSSCFLIEPMCVSFLTEPMHSSFLAGMQAAKSYCFSTEQVFVCFVTEPMHVSVLVGMQEAKSYCALTKD